MTNPDFSFLSKSKQHNSNIWAQLRRELLHKQVTAVAHWHLQQRKAPEKRLFGFFEEIELRATNEWIIKSQEKGKAK